MSVVGNQIRTGVAAVVRRRAIWLVLLALTTLATMVSLFTYSIDAQEGEFFHALRAGEITTVAVGHSQDFRFGTGFASNSYNSSDDIAVCWVNRFGVRRMAVLNELYYGLGQAGGDGGAGASPSSTSVDPAASIAATARSLGAAAPATVRPGDLPLGGITWLPRVVTILMIVIMIFGPQPRRTTRWGAFWAYSAPLNIGIFWALLRDSPWNQRMNQLPEPRAGDGFAVNLATNDRVVRRGGWNMFFLVNLAAPLALSLLVLVLMWPFPDFVDPVAWTAVNLSGNPLTAP
jgi:hypothetical protein